MPLPQPGPWGLEQFSSFVFAGDPNGSVTSKRKGDLCLDITAPAIYQATAPNATTWQLIGSGGGGSFPDFTGSGSPEGVQTANVGQSYVDTTNGALYFKLSGAATDTGWVGGSVAAVDPTTGFLGFDLNNGKALILGPMQSGAAVVLSDTAGFDGTGNALYWDSNDADGAQDLFLQLGSTGQFSTTFAADGSTSFPGPITAPGGPTTLALSYDGQGPFDFQVYGIPVDWANGTGALATQIKVGTNIGSGLLLQPNGDPVPDGWTFPATVFVEGTTIFDIVAVNPYVFGTGGILSWGASGGIPSALLDLAGTYLQDGSGDPNGVVTAPEGSLFLDKTTPAVWQNTNGATAWTQVGGGLVPAPPGDGAAADSPDSVPMDGAAHFVSCISSSPPAWLDTSGNIILAGLYSVSVALGIGTPPTLPGLFVQLSGDVSGQLVAVDAITALPATISVAPQSVDAAALPFAVSVLAIGQADATGVLTAQVNIERLALPQ